ncbi:hypothetical protein Tco_1357467 [Tanacetum coccineum]
MSGTNPVNVETAFQTDTTNNNITNNVTLIVTSEELPQLLHSRGGSHVTNVPQFDVEDFFNWRDSAKAGEKFKKAQDAEHQVLKREHSQKVKRLTDLNKKRAEQYMWTMTNRIKPEPITDVKIHPNTKPIVLSVYKNNDKRNFDVHQPFKFTDFGITKLDELDPIIQKKKNSIVKDLMTSLSKRYERLKKISKELGIQSALPALVPEQALSQTS